MKIIALEEHIGNKQLGDATHDAINTSYPYYTASVHSPHCHGLTLRQLPMSYVVQ